MSKAPNLRTFRDAFYSAARLVLVPVIISAITAIVVIKVNKALTDRPKLIYSIFDLTPLTKGSKLRQGLMIFNTGQGTANDVVIEFGASWWPPFAQVDIYPQGLEYKVQTEEGTKEKERLVSIYFKRVHPGQSIYVTYPPEPHKPPSPKWLAVRVYYENGKGELVKSNIEQPEGIQEQPPSQRSRSSSLP